MGQAAGGGCHGNEASADSRGGGSIRVCEEAERGWCLAMEVEEPTLEAGVGDEATPTLAHQAGADEARRTVGRQPEKDLFDELVHQQRWRRRRRRRHDSCLLQIATCRAFRFSAAAYVRPLQTCGSGTLVQDRLVYIYLVGKLKGFSNTIVSIYPIISYPIYPPPPTYKRQNFCLIFRPLLPHYLFISK